MEHRECFFDRRHYVALVEIVVAIMAHAGISESARLGLSLKAVTICISVL